MHRGRGAMYNQGMGAKIGRILEGLVGISLLAAGVWNVFGPWEAAISAGVAVLLDRWRMPS